LGKTKLKDVAKTVRSKNAGPFVLVLDAFFKDEDSYLRVKESGRITAEKMAELYGVAKDDVMGVAFFGPARALKISMRRSVASAAPGDTDVFGAQQHVPLLEMEVD